jgi:hypothetical protein
MDHTVSTTPISIRLIRTRSFHVHRATEEAILAGLRPEKFAEKTQYASYREALQYFIRLVGIVDASLHFPDEGQANFPFLEEEPLQ